MTDLREQLWALEPSDATAAEDRAWQVASAAFAQREPAARRRSLRPWAAAVLLATAATAIASPAGADLRAWVSRTVDPKPPAPKPALTSLPARGSILALAGADLWLVHDDGSRRRLGTYDDATFSPQARFVAVVRGSRLAAVDPRGQVRWSLDRRGGVADPRWAPSGLRVAYLAGRSLRVVYGDGNLDRRVQGGVAAVAPGWRPGPGHVLTWVAHGRVVTADTDSGRRLWQVPVRRARALAWSPDGRELLVVRPGSVTRLGADGAVIGRVRSGARDVAWLPGGRSFLAAGRSRLVRHDATGAHVLFSGPGGVEGLAVSADGRWAVVGWSAAGQWLFVRTDGRGRPRAAAHVARDFTPQSPLPPFPRPLGWR